MSGFNTRWLDLREPADRAARDDGLRFGAISDLDDAGEGALVIDLGCGTGSTFRALLPDAGRWYWRLIDNDPQLLAAARGRHAGEARMEFIEADLAEPEPGLFAGARLVTASALFDLVSAAKVHALAERLRTIGSSFYAALNYDGNCRWDNAHVADGLIIDAFNRHQRGDKGFGPALGPDSGPALKRIFEQAGFTVSMAASPWRLGPAEAEMQAMLIDGMAEAVGATGRVDPALVRDWHAYRLDCLSTSRCKIGHWDVLAHP